jgi:hypothetical protein
MRRFLSTALFVCLAIMPMSRAMAQSSIMPGAVVSNSSGDNIQPVGSELPRVANPVGKGVSQSMTNLRPYNPERPYDQFQGTNLNVKSVVTPANGAMTNVQPTMFSQVVNTIKTIAGLNVKPTITPIFTPGIYRRDRERAHERMFVHD